MAEAPSRAGLSNSKDEGFSSPSKHLPGVVKKMIRSRKVWIGRGSGVTLNGGETNEMPPMNPEGDEANVPQGPYPRL
ncbi:hypothetical protein Shell_0981 [Staphylothermus hellenicus DSM 12710]|uniref:Uncharacterized protein n=1 Tax=Staphylothermus hellenicus (strain DSM 12710 / JCM 10830 / BK20S6-10-b1 / P8) TaxID=591019 RepID=D7D8J1_STAHD|nr:hypothetical protein Shell_0981 [Staphylothermus hellenicus DSM 12710]